MNREIKFRVWDMSDPAEHKMLFLDPKDGWSSVWLREDVQTKVMQFTGLKDKNGVEIYEGDIVSRAGAYVVWHDRVGCWSFQFKECEGQEHPTPLMHDLDSAEVIGNIYEHSHLLEDPKCTA